MPTSYEDSLTGGLIHHTEGSAVQGDETPTEAKHVNHYELPEHNYYSPVEPSRSSPTEITSGMYLHNHVDEEASASSSRYPNVSTRSPPPPRLSLPMVTSPETTAKGDLWSLPSQKPRRVVNSAPEDEEEDWPQEALMHMNLAGENMNLAGDTNRLSYSKTPPPPPPHPPGWAS
jgi:hypothetical protein